MKTIKIGTKNIDPASINKFEQWNFNHVPKDNLRSRLTGISKVRFESDNRNTTSVWFNNGEYEQVRIPYSRFEQLYNEARVEDDDFDLESFNNAFDELRDVRATS